MYFENILPPSHREVGPIVHLHNYISNLKNYCRKNLII